MNVNICILLTLLAVIFSLAAHLFNLRYKIYKIRSCLNICSEIIDREQEKNRNNRAIILDLEQQLEHRMRQMVDMESIRTQSPIIMNAIVGKGLCEDKE